nr:glycosyltransferase family 4 protein [Rhizobium setariae]
MFRSHVLQRVIPKSRAAFESSRPIEVDGYFSMTAGIAESARLCVDALARARIAVKIGDVSPDLQEAGDVEWQRPPQPADNASTRIVHLNPPMLPRAIARIGLGKFARTYNIGYWAWELEIIPDEWKRALRYMNAVFAPSSFTARAIARHTDIPVIVVPHPVTPKPAAPGMRARFGIPEDAFLISTIFSAGSSINRKNPEAVFEAFRMFSATHPEAYLLMKASGNPARDERLGALVERAKQSSNIRIVADLLPTSHVNGIIAQSDAYVSLHRSEGFGLTVAEAILSGTPVVSTGWSGTSDFCDPDNTWNTRYRLIPVVDTHPEFAGLKDAVWADADATHAAIQLSEIAGDPSAAAAKAGRAKDYLERYLAEHTYRKALAQLASA